MRIRRISILALFAVALTAVALWFTNGAVAPKEANWNDVENEAKKGGYQLITTEELRQRYSQKQSSLLIVDTRQEWEYRTGHIKGAVNFPMEPTWFARWRKKGELVRFLGDNKGRTIVFY